MCIFQAVGLYFNGNHMVTRDHGESQNSRFPLWESICKHSKTLFPKLPKEYRNCNWMHTNYTFKMKPYQVKIPHHFQHHVISSYLWISETPGLTQGWRCSPGLCRGIVPPACDRLSCESSCSCSGAPQVSAGLGLKGTRETAPKVHRKVTESLKSSVYTLCDGWTNTRTHIHYS